jgi:hypothetical protein
MTPFMQKNDWQRQKDNQGKKFEGRKTNWQLTIKTTENQNAQQIGNVNSHTDMKDFE